jgi:murein L,D-transpeptidase YafK
MMCRFMVGIAVVLAVMMTALLVWANRSDDAPLATGAIADRIVVWKSKRQMELYAKGQLLKSYRVSLGRHPAGSKQQEGDGRTREGLYAVELHNPQSTCHKALKLSYPSAADRAAAAKRGVDPGGYIMIHGLRNGLGLIGRLHRYRDWTLGCIGVTDPEIDEIYRAVPDGTPVEIHP